MMRKRNWRRTNWEEGDVLTMMTASGHHPALKGEREKCEQCAERSVTPSGICQKKEGE